MPELDADGGSVVPTKDPCIKGLALTRNAKLLLVLATSISVSSCKSSRTIWHTEAQSPDGKIVASARAVSRNEGLSIISGIDTNVYLGWAGDTRPPTLILTLADGSDMPSDTSVEMKWITPTHLTLTYQGNQTLAFQAVRWANVEISVQDLHPRGKTDTGHGARSFPEPPPFAYQKTR
jgi:hypothetical protein